MTSRAHLRDACAVDGDRRIRPPASQLNFPAANIARRNPQPKHHGAR